MSAMRASTATDRRSDSIARHHEAARRAATAEIAAAAQAWT